MDTLKIIIIPNLPYTYRDHLRFGTEFFLKKGYNVEVWDIHHILLPGYKEKVDIDYFTFHSYYELNTMEELISKVYRLKENDFILFNFGSGRIDFLSTLKSHTKAQFIIHAAGAIPLNGLTINVDSSKPRKTFPTDIVFAGSPKDIIYYRDFLGPSTKIVEANSRDYDTSLKSTPYSYKKKYCVYIDTDAIDASDYVAFDVNINIIREQYFNKLFDFLNFIQHTFGYEVIIAAHPKSRQYYNKATINGFKIEHNKTAELIQNCEFVLNEGTSAISYAILHQKPILFFTLEEIKFFVHTFYISQALSKKIIDINDISHINIELILQELANCNHYDSYKLDYLTFNDDGVSTFEIMDNYFRINEN